jgi:probable rRNA maturation factor
MKELQLRNRQRDQRINLRVLREVTVSLLEQLLGIEEYELGIHFISAARMANMNSEFLQHQGPTDVITFDLRQEMGTKSSGVGGEIFICPRVAEQQARMFRTRWQSELVRYVTHGILHLLGYDDLHAKKRSEMKREENRLMRMLEKRFALNQVAR